MVLIISFCFIQLLSLLSFNSSCPDELLSVNKSYKYAMKQIHQSVSPFVTPTLNNSNDLADSGKEHIPNCEHCTRCSHVNIDLKHTNISFNSNPLDITTNDYLFIYNPPHIQSVVKPPIYS